jgi:hypothetical protein
MFVVFHVLLSAAVATAFASRFGYTMRPIVAHVLLVAEWELALVALASGFRARLTYRFLMAVTCTLQAYLYLLHAVSNMSWGRNMTGHLVLAFGPALDRGDLARSGVVHHPTECRWNRRRAHGKISTARSTRRLKSDASPPLRLRAWLN